MQRSQCAPGRQIDQGKGNPPSRRGRAEKTAPIVSEDGNLTRGEGERGEGPALAAKGTEGEYRHAQKLGGVEPEKKGKEKKGGSSTPLLEKDEDQTRPSTIIEGSSARTR